MGVNNLPELLPSGAPAGSRKHDLSIMDMLWRLINCRIIIIIIKVRGVDPEGEG